ncbi:signal peptide peptidase SppA [Persicimonas caeni]|uniref:signal peptide peptidase SppA n=1 Tax=Persicimonas caeni TaxID=2292766 RepID=UPI00143D563B|nr:signal peptide peptidase SppA [Persicimonas caeni]
MVAAATCFALPASADAQDEPTPTNGLVLPDQSVTTRADAISLELNPAGLGFIRNGEAAVGVQQATGDFEGLQPEGTGLFLAGGNGTIGAGFGLQWLDRPQLDVDFSDYRKYTFGLGLSTEENFSFGFAYNFFGSSDSELLDDLDSWDVGLMWRPSANVGFGLRARDLNQPFLNGDDALPVRTAIGMALRFFDGRVLLDPTFEFTSDGDSIFLRPRLLIEPIDGVRFFGRTEWDMEFENDESRVTWAQTVLGLALNTTVLGLETAAIADFGDDNDFLGHTHLAWVSEGKRRGFGGRQRRWVLVDLTGGIAEQPVSGFFGPSASSFMSLLVELENLTEDETVEGVVLNVGQSDLGYAQIWEVRQAVKRMRKAGKETVTVLTNPTYRETYLGSVTEHVWLIPAEPYSPDGLSLNLTSYSETLAKAGIQAEFLRIGRYKSAPETYTYRQPSKEALEQTTRYLDGLFNRTIQALANDLDMDAEKIEEMVNRVPLFPAQAAEEGFIDKVVYLDNVEEKLRDEFGAHVSLEREYPEKLPAEMRWGTRPEIAVVVIEGSIVRGRSGRTPFINEVIAGSDTLTQIFDKLRRDPLVRAVVVRIDSPGGSAVGSDLIYREMRRLAEKKPVVASMGNIAASGGYYVAAGADEIFASPNTLTGSIGIFTGKFSISKLADVIGIGSTKIERGDRSGAFDIYQPWTEEEKKGVARSITYLYKLFIQQVARTRPLSPEEVDAVGRGRIWDGVSAEDKKLVDQLGGLMDAIRRAEELAGVRRGEVTYELYPESLGLFDASDTSVTAKLARKLFGQQEPVAFSADAALGSLVRRLGKGILLPALYEDGEPLMLLPHVVEID